MLTDGQGMDNVDPTGATTSTDARETPALRRRLTLPLLVLYGVGVTVGAGIYVLVGATAGRAGIHAPSAFLLAALVMSFTAASFAELAGRYPVSAGEAAYVRAGFDSATLALLIGCLVIGAGVVSSAAISIGSAGYIRQFIDLPNEVIIPIVIGAVGLVAAWGILESVLLAGLFTIIEVVGLLVIIAFGFAGDGDLVARIPEVLPLTGETLVWTGIASAGLLAFFAFIGFEDLVNVAEETRDPVRTMPRAIFLTLIITTVIYFLVASIAVLTIDPQRLAASEAPLALVFHNLAGASPDAISTIAIIATFNTMIVQVVMASRVFYGLARQGNLPRILGRVSPLTRTPLIATGTTIAIVLILALGFPLEGLAEATSSVTLTIFAFVNLALIRLKRVGPPAPEGIFTVGLWVPVTGFLCSAAFLAAGFLVK